MKIGQYLAKIWTRVYSVRFFGPPCIYAQLSNWTHLQWALHS